jgi:serine/threonine protein kinase
MSLPAGTQLGPYEVMDLLGAGAMGEVYRARDTRLRRQVAVKVLPSSIGNDPARLRRFELEARAAGALNHPNIVAIHDVGQESGSPYVVSELLEGETLRERMGGSPLPTRKVMDLLGAG